jgi:hypothetical protein
MWFAPSYWPSCGVQELDQVGDGFDPLFRGQRVEIDGSEEIAVVGHGQGRHPVLFGLGDQPIELARPVEERILGMEMKVDEVGVRHDDPSVSLQCKNRQ